MSKLKQMRQSVQEELKHIPNLPLPQGELRMAYWQLRLHSLGKKGDAKTPYEVLQECMASLEQDYPGYAFQYDRKFFRVPSGSRNNPKGAKR
jgi:hypothetical protein